MDNDFDATALLWVEDNGQASTPRTRKRAAAKKKMKFVGWCSRELIEFLESIGKDTTKKLSHYDVTKIVNQYVIDQKLIIPDKKKRITCDERLQLLFGVKKRSIYRNKIHDFLEPHLAENHVESDDDLYSSDEKEEDASPASKRQKSSSFPKKKSPEVSKSCLAAILPENIKLVYLRRTLIQELLSNPETFESKVVGSFVRIKSDPLDIFQKNSHQLQVVTGINSFASTGENRPPVLLLSGMTDEISISALSDDDFSEEECEDLRKRVKDGLLKQPTIGELEQKVITLHVDITKHWHSRELVLLKKLIDRANEKGWRHRVSEYRDRWMLLQKPAELSRLLSETPKVVAEEVVLEIVPDDSPSPLNQSNVDSPKVADWDWEETVHDDSPTPPNQCNVDLPKVADWDWEPSYTSSANGSLPILASLPANGQGVQSFMTKQDGQDDRRLRSNGDAQPSNLREDVKVDTVQVGGESNGHANSLVPEERNCISLGVESNGYAGLISPGLKEIPNSEAAREESLPLSSKEKIACAEDTTRAKVEVIDLSDDEEEEQKIPCSRKQVLPPLPDQLAWYYYDPQGLIQGPFSLVSLKRWSDLSFFPANFKVWMNGQTPNEAVLLRHILQKFSPN